MLFCCDASRNLWCDFPWDELIVTEIQVLSNIILKVFMGRENDVALSLEEQYVGILVENM